MAAFSAASDTLTASTICSTSAGGKEIRDLKQTLETVRWEWVETASSWCEIRILKLALRW